MTKGKLSPCAQADTVVAHESCMILTGPLNTTERELGAAWNVLFRATK